MAPLIKQERGAQRRLYVAVLTYVLTPAIAALVSLGAHASGEPVRSEFLYEVAPYPSCHASTIVESGGGLVAAWFGGTHERHPDVGVWVSRKAKEKWSRPVEVANGVINDETRLPCWNPVLFQPNEGPLMLFYKVGPTPRDWWGMLKVSTDHGRTWSAARRLPEGMVGPVKNKPIELAGGTLLCPASSEDQGWRVHFEFTDATGERWRRTGPVNEPAKILAIQPSILTHADGRLQAIGRTRSSGVFSIWSDDRGESWGEMDRLDLPNPSSGTDAVTLSDGRHLLVYNHSPASRSPLNVALSTDGEQWQAALVLEDDPDAPNGFSYPAVIQSSDGLVHITYTWKRERIKHVVVDPTKLDLAPIVDGRWPEDVTSK
ncbi:hypothetical protein Pla175_38330 [Pirellulimonas nuda]|uniref:Sialidase domain-containing protein n=1 Tax=Pirellulimonas nuda TaxID=2528009 RepID=A0A518DG46_9BACT|nr:sialidase family protein [Pirellulimonas nuda]QDU90429.1 hypothetical protein Pla175_38330 [Pirellulimonas nuda]